MITLRKMKRKDIPVLYEMALRAFKNDFEKFGVYPPFIKEESRGFRPPLMLGRVVLDGDEIVGGAFAAAFGNKGEIGTLFLDPDYQKKGIGRQMISLIEKKHPKVKMWKLETPSDNTGLHRFYESQGFVKAGEIKDPNSGVDLFIYEKKM